MKGAAHPKSHGALRTAGLTALDGAFHGSAVPRNHDLPGRIEIGRGDHFVPRGFCTGIGDGVIV
jgi:hypothetical protein